jgi:hypothetical protein
MSQFYVFPEQEVAYLCMPKNASSTITNAFGLLLGLTRDDGTHALPFTLQYDREVDPRRLHRFTVVRNPFDRLVSHWANITCDRARCGPQAFERGLESVMPETPFHEFLELALRRPDGDCNWHITSQSYVATDFKYIDRIIRYETLLADWKCFVRAYPLVPMLTRKINFSQRGPWRGYFTPRMLDNVLARYEKDFELLGYECP